MSPTTAADVFADLGDDVDVILDGGPCRVGVESTIVDCSRTGAGDPASRWHCRASAWRRSLGRAVPLLDAGEVRAPGTLESHYAPDARRRVRRADDLADRIEAALARDERVGVIGVDDPRAAVQVLGVPRDGEGTRTTSTRCSATPTSAVSIA